MDRFNSDLFAPTLQSLFTQGTTLQALKVLATHAVELGMNEPSIPVNFLGMIPYVIVTITLKGRCAWTMLMFYNIMLKRSLQEIEVLKEFMVFVDLYPHMTDFVVAAKERYLAKLPWEVFEKAVLRRTPSEVQHVILKVFLEVKKVVPEASAEA